MALFEAINCNDVQRVRESIDQGEDVNGIDRNGHSLLSLACFYGNAEIVKVLIDAGADVNDINTDWTTPLLLATQEGHVEIVEMLLDACASTTAGTTADGLTAIELAEELVLYSRNQNYNRIVRILHDTLW